MKRIQYDQQYKQEQKQQESFLAIGDAVPKMENTHNTSLPLNQYAIKASFNSACTPEKDVSLDQITKVLSNGFRFLDFEIYSVKDKPVVAYSSQTNFSKIESNSTLAIKDVFDKIATQAFGPPVLNSGDPLFIQLRIKTNKNELYPFIASAIKTSFGPSLYSNKINGGKTLLSDVMGKVVIVLDTIYVPEYKNFLCEASDTNCVNLSDVVSIDSGTTNFKSTNYLTLLDQPKIPPNVLSEDGTKTDITQWQMVTPEIGVKQSSYNPDFVPFYRDYGVQIVPIRFYIRDDNCAKYEKLFTTLGKTAFVSMSKITKYMKQIGNY